MRHPVATLTDSMPKRWNHCTMAMDARKDPEAKAADPSMLFSPPFRHLCFPNCRPTRSAMPSPTAIWSKPEEVGGTRGDVVLQGRS